MLTQEVHECARVDRPRPGRHRDALERAEPHRRVDRAAGADGSDRAAAAEMADDEPLGPQRAGDPLDGEPVEAVATDPPGLAPTLRDGVRRRFGRNRRVESGVEDRHVRHIRQLRPRAREGDERGPVVQRRERGELLEPPQHVVVGEHRLDEARAAVDDPVAGRLGPHAVEAVEPPRAAVLVDEVELQAGRAGIDDEDVAHGISASRPNRECPGGPRRTRGSRRASADARRRAPGAGARRRRRAPAPGRSRRARGGNGRGR